MAEDIVLEQSVASLTDTAQVDADPFPYRENPSALRDLG